ncbi:ABC transporter ATP-binding protein [Brucella pseudogrignonensis]|jgi:branched-chain amino acid transport system ATP-binding protein|uniref:ATP-binding cassette domain-containing protein n=1 Tax=Brucella pseudogrignonensis TaxID=419475 RepID=A0A7Y3T8Z6_9HYPH|nr:MULTISPECIES: ATP-binding cassette domain-containing protein [Brucella]MCM0753460.1 ABC transporter ATP-binding protein [Brucella pseudogrignonensis]NNV23003.1 ATP-binding cassette domain-containing protein [Brucella pseudogrignonensis]
MNAGLNVKNIRKAFGGLVAINDVSFSAAPATITGIIGVNGAGKSTLLNCLCGLYTVSSGEIIWNGHALHNKPTDKVAAMGMGRTFQIPRLFNSLTLSENIAIGETGPTRHDEVDHLLEQVHLYRLRDNLANELSGGQKKLIELLRIQYHKADLILLDEPFAGVHPDLIRLFLDLIAAFRAAGKTVLLISHDLTSIYELSDNIIALNQGEIIAEGTARDIQNSTAVVEAYLGE